VWEKSAQTPLTFAAQYGKIDSARLLIEKGATVNVKDVDGNQPMHFAATGGNADLVQLLIDKKAKVNPRNKVTMSNLFSVIS
jgi:ankyrin repeat protein